MFRSPQEAEERRKRMKSEMSTALYYPSYLERGPDYEAEMRYFSGDTLSPRDSKVKKGNICWCSKNVTCVKIDCTLANTCIYM